VHAYEDDGLDFVRRLDGMFAFALWDRTRRRLVLGRDRFGKKPLYYMRDGRRLAFASEMKALLLVPGARRDLDPLAVSQYFTFGYVPAPRSILAGVAKLGAGQVLTFADGDLAVRRYWQLDFTPRCGDDAETAARRVRDLALEAVRKRLISEVPLGAFLSGGVDSSIVVAAMSQVGTERVKTFSIGFEEESHSELDYARLIATRYATDHHEFIVRPDLLDVLPRLAWAFDEPFADASMVPTYYVSKLARQHVTVALSGDGGDELYGGYRRYTSALEDMRLARRLGPLRAVAPVLGAALPDGMRGKNRLSSLAGDPAAHYVELASIFPSPFRSRLLDPRFHMPD
ncbi:MAG: asparagine synthase (glutamine-hydrolyzing), partial [Ktedonobacterales bacterium]